MYITFREVMCNSVTTKFEPAISPLWDPKLQLPITPVTLGFRLSYVTWHSHIILLILPAHLSLCLPSYFFPMYLPSSVLYDFPVSHFLSSDYPSSVWRRAACKAVHLQGVHTDSFTLSECNQGVTVCWSSARLCCFTPGSKAARAIK
jgi:hypothetical protein